MAGGTDCYWAIREAADPAARHRDISGFLQDLACARQRAIRFDFLDDILHDCDRIVTRVNIIASGNSRSLAEATDAPTRKSCAGRVGQARQRLALNDVAGETRSESEVSFLSNHRIRSCYIIPLTTVRRLLGALATGGKEALTPKLISNSPGRLHARLRWL